MAISEARPMDINTRVNLVVGIKQYRQVKKVMEEFDSRLQQEQSKVPSIDQRIK